MKSPQNKFEKGCASEEAEMVIKLGVGVTIADGGYEVKRGVCLCHFLGRNNPNVSIC